MVHDNLQIEISDHRRDQIKCWHLYNHLRCYFSLIILYAGI